MCGFSGFLDNRYAVPVAEWASILGLMGERLLHRGPDDGGIWFDPEVGVGLAHRRLAILDISTAGHQPMLSASGRYAIAFNGEIYNHQELRQRLILDVWHGHSDTETLLAAFEAWGVEQTLQATVGMFALALWDRAERTLILARDRLGEKPLYYGWQGSVFLFGSELKALKAHPAFAGEVNRDAITLLLRHKAIGAPHSIYKGISKLEPGCWLALPASSRSGQQPVLKRYWSLVDVALTGLSNPIVGTDVEVLDSLEIQLMQSVKMQQLSDVPLGAFLSGGVDSSLVVALMQAQSSRPVRTFSIGFHESGYNEAHYAKAVARYLGTDHTELYLSPEQVLAVVPKLPAIWDEPFSDSSQIPTYLVAQMARQSVTVALSGDGGDELFGGYERYAMTQKRWRLISPAPGFIRSLGVRVLQMLSPRQWDLCLGALPLRLRHKLHGERLHHLADTLASPSATDLYRRIISHWKNPAEIVLGSQEPKLLNLPVNLDFLSYMMLHDGLHYLPTDILTKVDRAAMSVSLETRVPFLDHRVVELAWRLPATLRNQDGHGKWPLRQVLYRHVPRELIDRPKMGFGAPIDAWLRGPLRDWGETLLDESRLCNEGFFNPTPIRRKWLEHQSKKHNWHYYLWDVLMFQAWHEQQSLNT